MHLACMSCRCWTSPMVACKGAVQQACAQARQWRGRAAIVMLLWVRPSEAHWANPWAQQNAGNCFKEPWAADHTAHKLAPTGWSATTHGAWQALRTCKP